MASRVTQSTGSGNRAVPNPKSCTGSTGCGNMAGKAKSVTGAVGNGNRSPYGPRFSSQPDMDKDGDVMGDTDMDMD